MNSFQVMPSWIARPFRLLAVLSFVCCTPEVIAVTVLQGPVLNPASNRTYYLLSPSSWTEAEATAVLLGGHLAAIGNQAEQDWVWSTFSLADSGATGCLGLSGNRPDGLWMGLNDLATEGTFVWSTPGEAVTYTNWGPGQPDNGAAGEDYVVMSGTVGGAWLDVMDTVAACRVCGVVEVMPSLALAYYGDVEPAVDNSLVDIFGIGHGRFVLKQGTKVGGVVDDATAIDGKAYRLNDTIAGDGTSAVNTEIWASRNNSGGILNFIEASGSTVVARVRVVNFNEPGAMMGIDDRGANNRNAAKIGWSGAVPDTAITEFYRNQSASLAHDGNYHIYRLTSGVEEDGIRRVKCFFDENPTPILVIDPAAATQTPSVNFDGWIFGTEGWQGASDAYFDWVVGCDAGTVEPGQTHFLNDYIAQLLDPNAQRCGFSVVPMVAQTVMVSQDETEDFTYTLTNTGLTGIVYTVQEVDVNGDPRDYPWLALSKTGGSLPVLNSVDAVIATADATGLTPALHTAYLKFSNDCTPANVFIRAIEINVVECQWTVSGGITVYSCDSPASYAFRAANTGGADLTYTAEEVTQAGAPIDYSWLVLDKTAGGPIGVGVADDLIVTVHSPNTANIGYVKFTPNACVGRDPQIREINVREFPNSFAVASMGIAEYHGNTRPSTGDSCRGSAPTPCRFIAPGCDPNQPCNIGSMVGEVELDPDAVDGMAWRIVDIETNDNNFILYRTDFDLGNVNDGWLGSTLMARMKVASNTNAGGLLMIFEGINPSSNSAAAIGWGGPGGSIPGRVQDFYRGAQGEDTGSGDAEYHLFRVTSGYGPFGTRTVNVYLDEDPEPVLTIDDAGGANPGYGDGFGFGMQAPNGMGDVSWDWITWTNVGMFAPNGLGRPGDEVDCLGASLIPSGACCLPGGCEELLEAECASRGGQYDGRGSVCDAEACCPDPFADADEDGDVDMTDFAAWQLCVSGPGQSGLPLPEACFCYDRNSDGIVSNIDFNAFASCAGGAEVPVDPDCD